MLNEYTIPTGPVKFALEYIDHKGRTVQIVGQATAGHLDIDQEMIQQPVYSDLSFNPSGSFLTEVKNNMTLKLENYNAKILYKDSEAFLSDISNGTKSP